MLIIVDSTMLNFFALHQVQLGLYGSHRPLKTPVVRHDAFHQRVMLPLKGFDVSAERSLGPSSSRHRNDDLDVRGPFRGRGWGC